MRGNIQDMQISGAFPIIFGVLGGKGFEKDGAHMFRAFAYLPMYNLHTAKFASCVHSWWRRTSPNRSIERNSGIGTSSSPSSCLLIGMHMTVYWKDMDEGAWEGPRRSNNILREQNGANTHRPDLQWIILFLLPFVETRMYFLYDYYSWSLLDLTLSSGTFHVEFSPG